MKRKLLQTARYLVAAAFLGYGGYTLIQSFWGFATRFDGDWAPLGFLVPFILVFSGVFLASGYFILRRRDRVFASIWVVIATVFVFGFVMGLPDRFGYGKFLDTHHNTRFYLLGGFLYIGSFIGAFYVARWFLRLAFRLLDRILPRDLPT